MNRIERLQYLFLMDQGLTAINVGMNALSKEMAAKLKKNPLDEDSLRLLGVLETIHTNLNMPRLIDVMNKEIHHTVMKPHNRQEVVDTIFQQATKRRESDETN